jgi:hypothetical protein
MTLHIIISYIIAILLSYRHETISGPYAKYSDSVPI